MIQARILNEQGVGKFREWLERRTAGQPPRDIIDGDELTQPLEGIEIDETLLFASRLEFGKYLNEVLGVKDQVQLLSPSMDGLWAWIAAVYFPQLSAKGVRRAEHYIVVRRGSAGSLTHRQAARTAYELVAYHGDDARICLRQPMHTLGQTLESLSAKQSVVHNRGFFRAAALLYMDGDKWVRGATSKLEKPAKRKPGDRSGMGGVRRLPKALGRLDLTYDVEKLSPSDLLDRLPREFSRFIKRGSASDGTAEVSAQ